MAHLRSFRCSGTIPRTAGAAVAAMRARAVDWDCPLVETPDRLGLVIWGCDFSLTPLSDGARIDLTGPEDRLVGALRDSATQLFAEVGLAVEWDRLEVGALAPGLALMRVVSARRTTPNFLRIRLAGPEAGRFGMGGLHFRLLLPPPGRAPVWPEVAATGRTIWPDGADALHRPVYTVAALADDWLEFDIFDHPGSPTCLWAKGDPVGQTVGVMGPGGGWCPQAPRLWLFGDETALPAIGRMLGLAQAEVRAVLRCAPADLGDLARHPGLSHCDDLLAALARHAAPDGDDSFYWFAAGADEARLARRHLLDLGLPKTRFLTVAYWS